MFTPNYNKPKFEIIIVAHENGYTMHNKKLDPEFEITFGEIIGALDIVKQGYIFDQSGVNAKAYKEWKEEQDKKAAEQPGVKKAKAKTKKTP